MEDRMEAGKFTGKSEMVETTNGDGQLIQGDREVILESILSVLLISILIQSIQKPFKKWGSVITLHKCDRPTT